MCGIVGFTAFRGMPEDARALVTRMTDSIAHRGPDAAGVVIDAPIALGHRRLSIIDLDERGNQPMRSGCGRYEIVFNGEIYNFPELRRELEASGHVFRTRTDTEVLLASYARDGVAMLERLNGMFAFAIWDRQTQELLLARDRLGKKPLYYRESASDVAFASELKALLCLPGVSRTLRPDALKDYFFHQYVPDPKTIFEGIHKLEPGCWMRVGPGGARHGRYWDLSYAEVDPASEDELRERLAALLDDAVRLRMVSDVPLGAFLSGGVDSSGVVALMAGAAQGPVTTCSIGFDSRQFDEVEHARAIAERFDTDHHEFTVRSNVAADLTHVASFFDEPFADPSFVPTFYVSELARRRVTVALAGDGGDESFAGYTKYRVDALENRLRSAVPAPIGRALHHLGPVLESLPGSVARRARSLGKALGEDPARAFFLSNAFFDESRFRRLASGDLLRDVADYDPASATMEAYRRADGPDHLAKILYADFRTFLPGDILVKVDRMSMAHGLEARAPLLDYRVVEFAATLPSQLKLRGDQGKYLLKRTLGELLPPEILHRPKMGFSVPLAQWLRSELRPIAQATLFASDNGLDACFSPALLRETWDNHQSGKRDHGYELWSMLMFALWWQNYGTGPASVVPRTQVGEAERVPA